MTRYYVEFSPLMESVGIAVEAESQGEAIDMALNQLDSNEYNHEQHIRLIEWHFDICTELLGDNSPEEQAEADWGGNEQEDDPCLN